MALDSSQVVPRYISDASHDQSNDEVLPRPKRRRQNIHYQTTNTFSSVQEAKQFLTNQHQWKYKSKSESMDGTKLIYLCKHSNTCPARVCIWLPSNSTEAYIQSTNSEHDAHQPQTNGIPPECKAVILELWQSGVKKPKSILDALRTRQVRCPTVPQLNNYLVRVRRGEGPPILSMGQLEEHINQSIVPAINDNDTPFVVNSYYDYDSKLFGVFWSTHRLLSTMDKSTSINIDATYKITYLGFPVLITGTTDRMRRFHPFGIALLTNEKAEAFSFVFKSLLKANPSYKPTILIADCASAITTAFESTFGKDYTRLYCWYHVKCNLDQKLKCLTKEKYDQVQHDLYHLQSTTSPDQFNVAAKCFITKWSRDEAVAKFVEFFEKEYILQRKNWFEGAALGHPSTNNSLEATNSTIKKEYTFRERLPLTKFIDTAEEIVRKWSTERNPDDPSAKTFATSPELSTHLQAQSYSLAKSEQIQVRTRSTSDGHFYFFPSSESNYKPIKEEEISLYFKKLKAPNWRSFDSFIQFKTRMWVVDYDDSNWLSSTCTCPTFSKTYICKHILAIGILNKEFKVKPEAKSSEGDLAKKRPRGRPKKVPYALVTD